MLGRTKGRVCVHGWKIEHRSFIYERLERTHYKNESVQFKYGIQVNHLISTFDQSRMSGHYKFNTIAHLKSIDDLQRCSICHKINAPHLVHPEKGISSLVYGQARPPLYFPSKVTAKIALYSL